MGFQAALLRGPLGNHFEQSFFEYSFLLDFA